jgi:hypothetical protein
LASNFLLSSPSLGFDRRSGGVGFTDQGSEPVRDMALGPLSLPCVNGRPRRNKAVLMVGSDPPIRSVEHPEAISDRVTLYRGRPHESALEELKKRFVAGE